MCAGRRWSRSVPWPSTDDAPVCAWLRHLQQHLVPGRYIGAWLDPVLPLLWLELALVIDDPAAALRFAARAGERAVYDLGQRHLIEVRRS